MKPKTKSGAILNNRRKKALQRLENQLHRNIKNTWDSRRGKDEMPLTDYDIKRIKKEIETLKLRIK